jgi:hypothetical protein
MTCGQGGAQNGPVDLDIDGFVRDGYVAVRGAFDAATAAACREMIWGTLRGRGVREDDPATWPRFAHIDSLGGGGPFAAAGMSPALGTPRFSPPRPSGRDAAQDRAPGEDQMFRKYAPLVLLAAATLAGFDIGLRP